MDARDAIATRASKHRGNGSLGESGNDGFKRSMVKNSAERSELVMPRPIPKGFQCVEATLLFS